MLKVKDNSGNALESLGILLDQLSLVNEAPEIKAPKGFKLKLKGVNIVKVSEFRGSKQTKKFLPLKVGQRIHSGLWANPKPKFETDDVMKETYSFEVRNSKSLKCLAKVSFPVDSEEGQIHFFIQQVMEITKA